MKCRTALAALLLVLVFLVATVSAAPAANADPAATAHFPADPDPLLKGMSEKEVLHLGEQMYRFGILPSGEVMEAFIHGDIEIDSTAFSCASCHQRAGLGSYEGGVVTPATTGVQLYQPYLRPPSLKDTADGLGRYIYNKTINQRPAYNRKTLKHVLRFGEDPVGEVLNDIMPRYPLDDRDLAILVRYLELLSRDFSPGATAISMQFATIVTEDVTPAERNALLGPMKNFIHTQNQQVDMYRKFIKLGYTPTGDMKYAFRSAALKVWDLKGPAETWATQLEAYQARDKVFAVLGGYSHQDWRPIAEFCEKQRLPCLFPVTELPVVSADYWYTFYFNKGYFQEGQAAARFLRPQAKDVRILQLVQDTPQGRALAAGFSAGADELGLTSVKSITLSISQLQDPKALAALVADNRPEVLFFWADNALIASLPQLATGPSRVFVSSTLLGQALTGIPDQVREKVFLTWPFRLKPYVGDEEGTGFLSREPINITAKMAGAPRIASRISTMLDNVVPEALLDIENNLYQDHLLDEISMQMDRVVFDYERISFGPGQRYASKGCYVIQLGQGPDPELLPRSEWVIH